MEFMGLCCAAPFVIGFFWLLTHLRAKKQIGESVVIAAIIGFVSLAGLAMSGEGHYVLMVEGLEQAAMDGNAPAAERLLKRGADPNEKDDEEMVPLQFAAFNGHADAVKVLLKYGANPNIEVGMDDHRSLVRMAADAKRWDIVKMLKDAGGKP